MDGIMNCLVYELHEDTKSVEVVKVDDFGRAGNYTSLFEQSQGVKNSSTEFAIDIPARISDDDLCKHVKAVLVRNIGIKAPWIIQANVKVRPEQKNIAIFEYRNLKSALLCVLLPIACFGASNKREVIDGIEWEIATDNNTYTLTSARAKDQWGGQGVTTSAKGIRPVDKLAVSGVVTIPTSVKGEKVTRICTDAFRECTGLTGVSIPDGILEIGERAFYGCTNLVSVDLGKVHYISCGAFGAPASTGGVWAMNLKSIVLPKELERIEKTSFVGFPYYVNGIIGTTACINYLKYVAISDAKIVSELVLGKLGDSYGEYGYRNGYFANATVYTSEELYDVVRTGMQYRQYASAWGEGNYVKEIKIGWSNPTFVPVENVIPYGDTFEINSMSTNMNTKVYYTIDGSVPTNCVTDNCYLYTEPIPITRKTKINAVAYVDDDSIYAEVSSMEYGFGAIGAIQITSTFGETFHNSGNVITLSSETGDVEIHYTLDGSEPTERSLLYTAPFLIDDTTTVKAKAFKEDWFESETATATFTREWYTVETPVIEPSDTTFSNVSQEVSISSATDGAKIFYTTDGSDPVANGREYTKPFTVYSSCRVRAVAVKYDWKNSAEVTATFTRSESLSEAVNLYGYTMETDEVVPWVVDGEVSRDGVSSVRSGAIGNNGTTWLQTSIKKAGTVSFWWKAACEDADEEGGEDGYYDYGAFLVDDVVVARIAGHDGEWHYVSHEVPSGGKHILKWEYRKDGATSYAPDCVWVDQVQWIPADGSGYTLTTPEPVPYAWLDAYRLGVGTDYETAGNAASGKMQGGRLLQVWQDYVAGTDPTNLMSRFAAKIEMVDGAPVVKWEPDLNTNGVIRAYKVYGKETLEGGGEWQYPTNSLHRFFKVTVEMP